MWRALALARLEKLLDLRRVREELEPVAPEETRRARCWVVAQAIVNRIEARDSDGAAGTFSTTDLSAVRDAHPLPLHTHTHYEAIPSHTHTHRVRLYPRPSPSNTHWELPHHRPKWAASATGRVKACGSAPSRRARSRKRACHTEGR
eukprot:6034532-Pleurochrysis_carterae.AAC.3